MKQFNNVKQGFWGKLLGKFSIYVIANLMLVKIDLISSSMYVVRDVLCTLK